MRASQVLASSGIAVATLVVMWSLLGAGYGGRMSSDADPSGLHAAYSATEHIEPNGTVSVPGILAQNGNTYTLLNAYTGSIEDQRNGSTLVGAGNTLSISGGTAGILVFLSQNVTVTGFNLMAVAATPGIVVVQSSLVNLESNNISTAGGAVAVQDSVSVNISHNFAPSTGGVYISQGSSIWLVDNNFTKSSSSGIDVDNVTGLVLLGNDFSHAYGDGFFATNVAMTTVRGNQFDAQGGDDAIFLDYVSDGNFSSNNLTSGLWPVYIEYSNGLDLWNDTESPGLTIAYNLEDSSNIEIIDSTALGPTESGAYLYGDFNITLLRDDFGGGGDGLDDVQCAGVLVQDSTLDDGANGIYVAGSIGLTVLGSDLTLANNGLYAQQTSSILVEDSNFSRANYPLNLTQGTSHVTVEGSDLNGAQIEGAYLNGVSDVTINGSSIQGAATYGVYAYATQGLTISSTNFSGSSAHPGPEAVSLLFSNDSSLVNDSVQWTDAPIYAGASFGLRIADSNLSNSSGTAALTLIENEEILVAGDDFYNASGFGVDAQGVGNLTLSGSNLGDIQSDGLFLNLATEVQVTSNSFDNGGRVGIFAEPTTGLEVSGNDLNNDSYAFFLTGGTDAVITNNTALADRDGGLADQSTLGLVIAGNNLSNDLAPDLVTVSLVAVPGFSVTGNSFFQDNEAVQVSGASQGAVVGNEFADDNLSFYFEGLVTALNYHNDFVSDRGFVITGSTTLAWDDGYPIGGNYWSNYTGVDEFGGPGQNLAGADGIGDAPMVLNQSNVDQYPLMTAWVDHAAVFVETGLPAGVEWSVVFNGTTYSSISNSISISSTAGTRTPYSFTIPTAGPYAASTSSGSGTLGAGLVVVDVTFAIPTYPLTFSESGLPSGTSWGVVVNGSATTGTVAILNVSLVNGTYGYSVTPVPGFKVTPVTGSVTVNGSPMTIEVSFLPSTFSVRVVEEGLPNGTSWGVAIAGNQYPSTGTSVLASLPNGTYAFTVNSVTGYTPSLTEGLWTVAGGPLTVYIAFVAHSGPASGGSGGLPTSNVVLYYAVIAILAVAAAAGWVLAARRRNAGGPDHSGTPAPAEPPPPGAR